MRKLTTILLTVLALIATSILQTSSATVIDILYDHTDAYSQVTYHNGVVSNPGTTTKNFSDALFSSGAFTGYDVSVERFANISLPGGFSDSTSFISVNEFRDASGEFIGGISIGSGYTQFGTTGESEAEISMNLHFQAKDGNTEMWLWSELFTQTLGTNTTYGVSALQLFDETTSSFLADLKPGSYDYESAYVTLLDSHIYSLTGYAFAYTPHSGDPYASFGFGFTDATIHSSVPEPASITLLGLALMGFGLSIRKR